MGHNALIDKLREGAVEHPKRWSGDTHDDLGGSVDYEATYKLMVRAADELERLKSVTAIVNDQGVSELVTERDKLRSHLLDCIGELERKDARMPHRIRVAALAKKYLSQKEDLK